MIQIAEETNIPYAPKAKKIIEEVKKKEEKVTSEQAPPKKVKKEKQDTVPIPDENLEKVKKIEEKKQNPCLLYTSPSPRDKRQSRMPSSA